jgi:hypothetical protein
MARALATRVAFARCGVFIAEGGRSSHDRMID